ncbi:hypothetical protein [Nonomuraea sp. NPDC050643]|uniref:hypothetical protein n=1 Tax=Nonomuraea sp. NPDC050643 TaxID=3155660 RepID=UPI003403C503
MIEHDNFDEFASDDPPRGLGASLSLLRALTVEDETAANRLERELSDSARSMPVPVDDGEMRPRSSPAQVAALRRLRKDAPALHARVLTGEMSAHAAMVQAGFRARTISVPVSRPESAAKALRNKLTREEIAELVALLSQDL